MNKQVSEDQGKSGATPSAGRASVPQQGGVVSPGGDTLPRPRRPAPTRRASSASRGGRRKASRLVDIAEAVGVHTSTVSRVLNGDPAQSVRPEIYEQILITARQQGYRPNALARALKRQRTGAFAFVIPLLRNPIWSTLQRGALQRIGTRTRRGALSDCGEGAGDQRAQDERTGTIRPAPPPLGGRRSREPEAQKSSLTAN